MNGIAYFASGMNTIVIRFNGGLGNQMFQYALGRSLSALHGARLLFDMDFFDLPPGAHTPRSYGLDAFSVQCDRATPTQIRLAKQGGSSLRAWLYDLHPRLAPDRSRRERGFAFDPTVLEPGGMTYFDGYWQSERYFAQAPDTLRKEFCFRLSLSAERTALAQRIKECTSVSVHVRRGDYIAHPAASAHFIPCDQAYYDAAIDHMSVAAPNAELFVFSDDLPWARDHIRGNGAIHFLEADSDAPAAVEMHLMSICHHHIIANSSFSWWGAWLNDKAGKHVIAPARWFADPRMDTRDLIPPTWIRL